MEFSFGGFEISFGAGNIGLNAADISFHACDVPGDHADLLLLLFCQTRFRSTLFALQLGCTPRQFFLGDTDLLSNCLGTSLGGVQIFIQLRNLRFAGVLIFGQLGDCAMHVNQEIH